MHQLPFSRMLAMSVGSSMVFLGLHKRETRQNTVNISLGAFALGLGFRGSYNWFRHRNFWTYERFIYSLKAGAVAPVLYGSACTMRHTWVAKEFESRCPKVANNEFYPYLLTGGASSVGAMCVSVALGYGLHLGTVYLILASGVAHYLYDYARIAVRGFYRKQVLLLHFRHIADELDDEVEVALVSIPFVTYWSARLDESKDMLDAADAETTELDREVKLYRTMQAEVFRLREELGVEVPLEAKEKTAE